MTEQLPEGTPGTLFHYLLAWAKISPDHPFVMEWVPEGHSFRTVVWSYRDAVIGVTGMAESLKRLGLPPGTAVGLVGVPGVSFVLALMALEAENLLPVLVDHALPCMEALSVLGNFGVKALSLEEGLWTSPELENAGIPVVTRSRHPTKPLLPEAEEWETFREKVFRGLSADGSRIACILMTSGTTGFPKGVPLTHSNLFSNISSIRQLGIYHRHSRVFGVLPLHHAYPLMSLVCLTLGHGATVAFPPDLQPSTLLSCLSEFKATLFPGVPSLWESFHRRIWEGIDQKGSRVRWVTKRLLMPLVLWCRIRLGINPGKVVFRTLHRRFGPSMEILASGGAALPLQVAKDFWAWGLTMLEGYGLTETSPVLTFNTPASFRIGSVGRAVPGVELQIRPMEGYDPGMGEVRAKGANIASEYLLDANGRQPVCDPDGWFSTGDIGALEDGFLFLKGREKELLVLPNGKKLQPDTVESLVEKNGFVFELALTLYNEVPWLLIRPDEEKFARDHIIQMRPVMESMVAALNARLPSHSRIGGFSLTLEPLPRTRLGKLKRFALPGIVGSLERRRASVPVPERILEDPAKKEVLRILEEITGLDRPISLDDHLEVDLGLDSLGRIELVGRLEEMTGREVPDEDLESVRTVADLLEMVSGEVKGSPGEKEDFRILEADLSDAEKALIPERPLGKDGSPPLVFRAAHVFARAIFSLFFAIRWPRFEKGERGGRLICHDGRWIDWPKGPCVIVANHASYLDGILLSLLIPPDVFGRVVFWGYSPLFEQGFLKRLRNLMGVVSIDPDEALTGLRIGYHLLKEGKSLAVFPEGERSPSGKLQPFRPGTGYLLSACPVPVVPVGIIGAFQAYPRHRRFPRPYPLSIRIGQVIPPDRFQGHHSVQIAGILEKAVRETLGED